MSGDQRERRDPGGGAKGPSRIDPLFDPELDAEPAPFVDPTMRADLREAMAAAAEPFDPTGPALPSDAKFYAEPATPPARRHKTMEMIRVRIADGVDPRRAHTMRIERREAGSALPAVEVAAPAGEGAKETGRRRIVALGVLGAALLVLMTAVGLQRLGVQREEEGSVSARRAEQSGALPEAAAPSALRTPGPAQVRAPGSARVPAPPAQETSETDGATGDAPIPGKPKAATPARPKPTPATPQEKPVPNPPAPVAAPPVAAPRQPAPAATTPQASWF